MTSLSKEEEGMRLNKFLAHSGLCSRRKAVELIESGQVKVNGKVELLPYTFIKSGDRVEHLNKEVLPIVTLVYFLLNKPKDVISTSKDDRGRKSVMDLIKEKDKLNLHTVGRLDRHTTGLLLLTNDGDLTQKLTHPSSEVKKIYHVELDKELMPEDLVKLQKGFELEDGFIMPDNVSMDRTKSDKHIGIELHSGRNRIIRRMLAHLGYEVIRLDRVYLAGLTKKDLPRGRYRPLTEKEVIMLKHFV